MKVWFIGGLDPELKSTGGQGFKARVSHRIFAIETGENNETKEQVYAKGEKAAKDYGSWGKLKSSKFFSHSAGLRRPESQQSVLILT